MGAVHGVQCMRDLFNKVSQCVKVVRGILLEEQ